MRQRRDEVDDGKTADRTQEQGRRRMPCVNAVSGMAATNAPTA